MTQRLDKILRAALWLLLAVTLGSCSQIYDDEGICEQEQGVGNRVNLKFKIYTDYNPSRSRGLGEWTEPSANVAERILNPDDVRVLLLNQSHQLVRSFKPNRLEHVEGKTEEGIITGDGYYELSVYFEDENLDRMEDHETISFNVMIFANINSLGGIYTTDGLVYGSNNDKLQELFTMPNTWFPSVDNGIPMYGYKSGITATKAQLAEDDYNMGDITMLRALSKIEVYDNVEGTVIDGQKYPYIEKVELTSWREKGYLRTLYDGYESGLTTAYIPGNTINPVITGENASRVSAQKMPDGLGIEGKEENKECFRVYCPEAKLKDVKVLVTATLGPNDYKTYEVELDQYKDEYGSDELVRNHIYRFSVNSLGAKADLTVTVSDWDHQEQTHTLDDIISMDAEGYLRWTNVAGNSNLSDTEVDGEMQLSFLGGTTDYATGTFKINSPEGATWRAFFIPGENGVDAFEFVDVDAAGNVITGSASSYVEGVIDGTPVTIHIRGKGQADAYRHTAKLVVEVHQADGSVLYAPIAGPGSTSYIIYRENKL